MNLNKMAVVFLSVIASAGSSMGILHAEGTSSDLLMPGFSSAQCRSLDPKSDVRLEFAVINPGNPSNDIYPTYRVKVIQNQPTRFSQSYSVNSDIIGGDPSTLLSRFKDNKGLFTLEYQADSGDRNGETRVLEFNLQASKSTSGGSISLLTNNILCTVHAK